MRSLQQMRVATVLDVCACKYNTRFNANKTRHNLQDTKGAIESEEQKRNLQHVRKRNGKSVYGGRPACQSIQEFVFHKNKVLNAPPENHYFCKKH